ncbi:uncharacterized protein LOC117174232 isoform X2 [Belonocnema kinseyi]|uniref:uncharacterized protein LOC117174232 isoform X2 n=1 Tax=Belonocnema kinseyi TaxID=2817044 RepID=UPI00143CEF5C|nr:uncharacterized protein LOC117174232 isoform X2 [Belonocnema kinseyi]
MILTISSDTLSGESQAGIGHCSELRFRASSSRDTVTMDPSCSKSCIKTHFKELQDTVLYRLSQSEIKSEALIKLKENFREVIGFKRDFNRICDFASLFTILKKRDELSYNKLEPFKISSDIIGDKFLRDKILKFEEKWQGNEFRDLYENAAHSSKATSSNMPGYPYNSTRETEMGKRALKRISERIGNRWRDMARNLDIREYDIDAIDAKYERDLKEKAYQALIVAQAESDPRRWKSNLMRALVEARRKDLADWIDENYHEN